MSTIAAIFVPADAITNLPACRDLVQDAFSDVEQRFGAFSADSELGRINAAAGNGAFVRLSPDVARVLHIALRLSEQTHGLFDPTVGPLMATWGFRGQLPAHAPDADELAQSRALVGWTNIIWNQLNNNEMRFSISGMKLDLGGIAKGYAVDLAYARAREAGFTDFLVDLGGNLRAAGEAAPHRGGWLAGIRNPFDKNVLLGSIMLTNGESIATSGNYERFVELDGHHYAHILNPLTGYPAEGIAGVTVLAPSGLQCDGLSATLFLLGPDAGVPFLHRYHPECEALWVPDRRPPRLVMTAGFARRFKPAPALKKTMTLLP